MPASTDLTSTWTFTGIGRLVSALDLSSPQDNVSTGNGANFDPLTQTFTWGTGNQQAKEYWHDTRTITAGANDDMDLAGGLTSPLGATITFTAIKAFLLLIDAHDGTKSLRVGPQGVANAWQGWHGGVAAGNYNTVHEWMVMVNSYSGWAVTAGTGDILRINNPGGTSVSYHIWILGMV